MIIVGFLTILTLAFLYWQSDTFNFMVKNFKQSCVGFSFIAMGLGGWYYIITESAWDLLNYSILTFLAPLIPVFIGLGQLPRRNKNNNGMAR